MVNVYSEEKIHQAEGSDEASRFTQPQEEVQIHPYTPCG